MGRPMRPANCDHDMPRRSCRCCALPLCRACFADTDCAGNYGGPHAHPLDDMAGEEGGRHG